MTNLLTPRQLDLLLTPSVKSPVAAEGLWGTKQIAAFLNRSPDTIRRITRTDKTFPARKRAGKLYANRIELLAWLAPRDGE